MFNVARGGGVNDIALVPLAGGPMRTLVQGGNNGDLQWSPDGTRLAFTSDRGGTQDLWLVDVAGGEPRQLTTWPGVEATPLWNADGSAIWFVSNHETPILDLWRVPAAGGEPVRVTHTGSATNIATGLGRPELFASTLGKDGRFEIIQVKPDGAVVPIWGRNNSFPLQVLPQGDSLAIAEGLEGGKLQVRILPLTGGGEGQIVNDSGRVFVGSSPDWSLVAYRVPNGAVQNLGLLNRKDAFNGTMVIGYYKGKPVFIEPMLSKAMLMAKRSFDLPIPDVPGLEGEKPTRFRAEYNAADQSYRFSFSGFSPAT